MLGAPPIVFPFSTTLLVTRADHTSRHEVRAGMTVGRDAACDVRVDHADICPIHARVVRGETDGFLRLRIEHAGFAFTRQDGTDAADVMLLPGVRFRAGSIELGCPGVPVAVRFSCPRCRSSLIVLPADARYCARCGLELPAFCPPWDGRELDRAAPAAHHHPMFFAYLNALFNLGIRYESRENDVEQAQRYFAKAAKLGSVPARVRLEGTPAEASP